MAVEEKQRRQSDHVGFNGWLAKWGEPANIARLLGSFLAVIFAVFTLIIGGYAWNMKIDDRSLDNRVLATANKDAIAVNSKETLIALTAVKEELATIRESQISISAAIKHTLDAIVREQEALIRHDDKGAHDQQLKETATNNAQILGVEQRLNDLSERVRTLERSDGSGDRVR